MQDTTQENKKQRGGFRGGTRPAGRNQKQKSFRISLENIEYLKGFNNANAFVNKLIEEHRLKIENTLEVVDSILPNE